MNTPEVPGRKWTERPSPGLAGLKDGGGVFAQFFERSADAIFLFDPELGVFSDCNQAAVDLLRCSNKHRIINLRPEELAPHQQPDGTLSRDRVATISARVKKQRSLRFEWWARRCDGQELPVEVLATVLSNEPRPVHVLVWRDITERKEAESARCQSEKEARIRQLNAELEQRIAERTYALVETNQQLRTEIQERQRTEALLKESEAQARTVVEHAPDAIVVFDFDTGRFAEVNQNAVRLYGLSRDELLRIGPGDVSPTFQPDGRLSRDAARQRLEEALNGGTPVFEWWHRDAGDRIFPCEIRLVRLPAQGRRLVRGSVIDNSERHRQERIQRAIYEISESIHTTGDLDSLYRQIHATIQGLMLASNFYIALYDPVSELFSFPYFVDEMDPPPQPRKLTTGLTSSVLRTGKPLLVNRHSSIRKGSSGIAFLIEERQEIPYEEVGTPAAVWLGAPLNIQGQTIGIMAVQDYREEQAYGEEEKRILTFVAEQTALAIDRKRAEQALRRRTEQVARHRDVLLELAQLDKSDFAAALERVCRLSAESLDVARVGFWKLEEDESGLALVCELMYLNDEGGVNRAASALRLRQQDCPPYFEGLSVKRPVAASRALTHPVTSGLAESYLKPLNIASMLDVPVWLHGRVIGVLCHEHVGAPREWTPEEIDFASSLATMVSLAHEAAQRARSEEALRESEEKFRALFEASSHGVMLHDREKYLEVNPAALRILRYDRAEDLIGRHPAETSAPIQPNGEPAEVLARRHIEACIEKGHERFEWVARSPRGEDVPIEVFLTRIPMGGHHIIQAVINDITDRKNAEAELLRALAREKELGQLKSNFVSMVSHEFRTPLGIIMSSAEILQDYLEQLDKDERQRHLQSIAKNTRRMADLMEEVLLLGKFEAGRMDCQTAPLDMAAFARRLVDEMLSATDRRCPIELDTPSPLETQADERLLRHIFTNLLSNAVKYSEPGHPVRITLFPEGAELVCTFQDQGIGIPPGDVEWLFKAFHRGRNVGQRPGSGLGLVIVKRSVELHRGRIRVDSKVGVGTTVTVRLPVCAQSK